MNQQSVKQSIQNSLGTFNRIAGFLQGSLVILGTVSVLSTIGVATFSKELQDNGFLKPVAYIAAASSALVMQFSLQRKSSDARTAWRSLRGALMKNNVSPEKFGEEQLIEAYLEAEAVLGHVVFTPPSQPGTSTSGSDTASQTPKLFIIEPKEGKVKFLGKIDLTISPPQALKLADADIATVPPNTGKVVIKSDSVIEYTAPGQAVGQDNIKVKIKVTSKDNRVAESNLEVVA